MQICIKICGGGGVLCFCFYLQKEDLHAALKAFGITVGKNGEDGHGHCG